MKTKPVSFIDEPIEVLYDGPTAYEKTPTCPDAFIWKGTKYLIETVLEEWRDFTRKGKMARNMAPGHADHASLYGSWGVGRFYFRVKVQTGQIFEIYYDRAPQDAVHRKGGWILMGERTIK
jgi:hypothetical protein